MRVGSCFTTQSLCHMWGGNTLFLHSWEGILSPHSQQFQRLHFRSKKYQKTLWCTPQPRCFRRNSGFTATCNPEIRFIGAPTTPKPQYAIKPEESASFARSRWLRRGLQPRCFNLQYLVTAKTGEESLLMAKFFECHHAFARV